jgi:hypothetical protein
MFSFHAATMQLNPWQLHSTCLTQPVCRPAASQPPVLLHPCTPAPLHPCPTASPLHHCSPHCTTTAPLQACGLKIYEAALPLLGNQASVYGKLFAFKDYSDNLYITVSLNATGFVPSALNAATQALLPNPSLDGAPSGLVWLSSQFSNVQQVRADFLLCCVPLCAGLLCAVQTFCCAVRVLRCAMQHHATPCAAAAAVGYEPPSPSTLHTLTHHPHTHPPPHTDVPQVTVLDRPDADLQRWPVLVLHHGRPAAHRLPRR